MFQFEKAKNRTLIEVLSIILCVYFIGFHSDSEYLYVPFLFSLLFIFFLENAAAFLVSIFLGGGAFLGLLKNLTGFPAVTFVLFFIIVEIILLSRQRKDLARDRIDQRMFSIFIIWQSFLIFYLLIEFFTSEKTSYQIYYIQYGFIFYSYSLFTGLLFLVYKVHFEDLILPLMIMLLCYLPLYDMGIQGRGVTAFYSTAGFREFGDFSPIEAGRLAGFLLLILLFGSNFSSILNKIDGLYLVMAVMICLGMLWLSQTRQAILSMLVIGVIFLLFFKERKKVLIYFLIPSAIILYLVLSGHIYFYQNRIVEANVLSRSVLYERAVEGILESPIFGHGVGGFYSDNNLWPHNWSLEIIHDYGLLGALLILFPAIFSFSRFFINVDSRALGCLALYWLLVAQFSGDFVRNYVLFFFIIIGFLSPRKDIENLKR